MPPQSTRFYVTNYAHTATLKNGTTGAPARDEDPDWIMEQALNASRGTPWLTSDAPADPMEYDADLGATRSVHGLGLLGFIGAASGISFPANLFLQYATGSTYPPASWTYYPIPSLSLVGQPRNVAAFALGPVSMRFIRFTFDSNPVGSKFGLGHFFIAGAGVDMVVAYSPGAGRAYLHERQNNPTLDRTRVKTQVGRDHVDETITFNKLDNAGLAKLLAIFTPKPFVMVTPFGEVKEMDLSEQGVRTTHDSGHVTDDRWSVTLDLEHLA